MGRRRLHPAVWRLALVAVIFACWMGYLGYLVSRRNPNADGSPLVVSRAQILVTEIAVVAQVDSIDSPVKVEEVLWEKNPNLPVRVGDTLKVTNLAACRAFPPLPTKDNGPPQPAPPPDFTGPGRYLLLLHRGPEDYQVVRVPYSPGYPPPHTYDQLGRPPGRPRIYPIQAGSTNVVDQFMAAAKPSMAENASP